MTFLSMKDLWLVVTLVGTILAGVLLLYTRTRANLGRIHPDSIHLVYPLSFAKLRWRLLLVSIGLIGMSLLLLRPALLVSSQTRTLPKMDIVFVVDISPSMRTRDLKPDRLDYAKHQLSMLVDQLGQYRMALVMFSGEAIVQTPMTPDPASILSSIETLNPENISAKGSHIDEALLTARGAFSSTPPTFRKIIILVTDGEDHGVGLPEAVRLLKKDNIRVYSIGIGSTSGAPIPVFDDNGNIVDYKKDASGRTVVSKLDPNLLAMISRSTNGQAYILGQEQADWRDLMNHIQNLESGKAKQVYKESNAREIGGLILFPSLLAILIGLALPLRLAPIIVCLLFVVMNTDSVFASERFNLVESVRNEIGNAHVVQKKFSPAIGRYIKNTETIPRDAVTHYNLGNALQFSGRTEEAQGEWAQALNTKPDRQLASLILYNQAMQFIQKGEMDKAQAALVKSLTLWSNDIEAKKNLEMALLALKQKQQQQKSSSAPQNKGQSGNKEQKVGQNQGGQGQFSKEQSEQILDTMMNNKMLRPNPKQKRTDDEQDW